MVDKYINVNFGSDNEFTLKWKLGSSSICHKWFHILKTAIPHGIREKNRFYNLPNQLWNKKTICSAMIECMKAIEQYYPNFFKVWPTQDMTNDITNIMHTDFERLRGSVHTPSDIWENANTALRDEIRLYNVLIHRWESFITNGPPRFVCTFKEKFITPLAVEDYKNFSIHHDYGAILLNYPLVGKQFLDLLRDDDWHISSHAILPMSSLAADFTVRFVDFSVENNQLDIKIKKWFTAHQSKLENLGFFIDDPKLALGWIQVATLVDNTNAIDLISKLGDLSEINSVWTEE